MEKVMTPHSCVHILFLPTVQCQINMEYNTEFLNLIANQHPSYNIDWWIEIIPSPPTSSRGSCWYLFSTTEIPHSKLVSHVPVAVVCNLEHAFCQPIFQLLRVYHLPTTRYVHALTQLATRIHTYTYHITSVTLVTRTQLLLVTF